MKKLIILIVVLMIVSSVKGQVKIGENSAPDPSAILELKSTTRGFLPPRVVLISTAATTPVTSPATGLIVYNISTYGTSPNNVVPGYYIWNGTVWAPYFATLPITYTAPNTFSTIVVTQGGDTNITIPGYTYTVLQSGYYILETSTMVQNMTSVPLSCNLYVNVLQTRNGTVIGSWVKNQVFETYSYLWYDRTFVGNEMFSAIAGDVITMTFHNDGASQSTGAFASGTVLFNIEANTFKSNFTITKLY